MSDQTAVTGGRASAVRDLAGRLYRGEAGLDVVGKRRIAYAIAGAILLIAVLTLFVRPFNLGIEFKGGNTFTVPASVGTREQVRDAFAEAGAEVATAQTIRAPGGSASYQIRTLELTSEEAQAIKAEVAEKFSIPAEQISEASVSGAWGAQVTRRAVMGACVFLFLVVVYLSAVFREWRMAVAALAGLAQSLLLTAAVYLVVGFEVTPSTVIGFLTILGFALYDTVVVFDKVRENTRGITGNSNMTYGEAANLAVNQTLMRSINTGVVALLPVGGILFIGAGLLGAGTLKDLGLVLFVGMLTAVYSSIFFATPVLVDLKEQEPRYKLHKQRVLARRAAAAQQQQRRQTAKSAEREEPEDASEEEEAVASAHAAPALAAAAPRVGSRPAAKKRTAGRPKHGGGKPAGRRKR